MNTDTFLYDSDEGREKVGLKTSEAERRAPVVSFVSSFEDDIDMDFLYRVC